MELLPLFEWLESSLLGTIGKESGVAYALMGQSIHLMALAILGGSVLVADLRLLGVVLKEVPSEVVVNHAHKWWLGAVIVLILTGIFMAAAIALRMYYSDFFWAKMSALAVGIIFVFAIKRPLLSRNHADIDPRVIKLVALASLMIWFSVAATGRWIGFS